MGLLGSTCSQPAIATAMGLIGAYDAGCTSTGSYAIINQSIYQLINYQTLQNPRAGREGTGKVNAVNPPVSRREEAGGARRAEGANHCARRHRARETLRGQFGQLSRDSGDPRNGIERDCSPAKAARTSAIETAAVSAHDLPRAHPQRFRPTRPRARSELLRQRTSARSDSQKPTPHPSSTHAKHLLARVTVES